MFGSLKKRLKEVIGKKKEVSIKEKSPEAGHEKDQPLEAGKEELKKLEEKAEEQEVIKPDPVEEKREETIERIEEESEGEIPEKKPEGKAEKLIQEVESEKIEKTETTAELEKIAESVDDIDKVIPKAEKVPKKDVESLEKIIKETPTPTATVEVGKEKSFLKKIKEKTLTEKEVEGLLRELEMAMLENDVSVEVSEKIVSDVQRQLTGKAVKRGKVDEMIKEALKNSILEVMKQETLDVEGLIKSQEGPFTIMIVGFNGTGKTTTLAKLANRFKDYKPILAAADTFRAASIEQLEEHGKNLGLRVIKHTYGSDSAAVIFDAKKHAEATGSKLVLADTAGRSHSNVNLMDELKKVAKVNTPDLKVLVLDSITGNDIYDQCKLFNDAVGVDAIILTKADVYERGGAALSAAHTLKKPIIFLGVGQEYKDLKQFVPEEIVDHLLE